MTGTNSTADGQQSTEIILPSNCSQLFRYGELQEHTLSESSFTEEDIGKPVDEFDLSNAETSHVFDMSEMFAYARSFNQDISAWDTSNVETMRRMFWGARSFNQDISEWDVSNVKYMDAMFHRALSFNQDITEWDVSNVRDMRAMFYDAKSFDYETGWGGR